MERAFKYLVWLEVLIFIIGVGYFVWSWQQDGLAILGIIYPISAAAIVAVPILGIGAVVARRKLSK